MKKTKEKIGIIVVVIICCVIMALVETIIEPAYFVKSAAKAAVFLLLPFFTLKLLNIKVFDNFDLHNKDIFKLLLLGSLIYAVIIGVFFLTRNIFDYSALVDSLSADQKVNSNSYIWIAIYISFCNSFLEEFLFRLIAFIKLSEFISKRIAYILSSVLFAVYHIAMIGSSFPFPLLMLALFGLAVGGFIFDLVDGKSKNIYTSWIIHMFADLAIMTIWYIHI